MKNMNSYKHCNFFVLLLEWNALPISFLSNYNYRSQVMQGNHRIESRMQIAEKTTTVIISSNK